jgi:hypothetical protein
MTHLNVELTRELTIVTVVVLDYDSVRNPKQTKHKRTYP